MRVRRGINTASPGLAQCKHTPVRSLDGGPGSSSSPGSAWVKCPDFSGASFISPAKKEGIKNVYPQLRRIKNVKQFFHVQNFSREVEEPFGSCMSSCPSDHRKGGSKNLFTGSKGGRQEVLRGRGHFDSLILKPDLTN